MPGFSSPQSPPQFPHVSRARTLYSSVCGGLGLKELRYRPYEQMLGRHPPQADVLDIVAEAPIGSPLRMPSPKTSPEILKTLHWIQNTLDDGDGNTHYSNKGEKPEHRVHELPDVNGCQVTFTYATRSDLLRHDPDTYHTRQQVNLGDLDPASVTVANGLEDSLGTVSLVTVYTTDKVPAVRLTANDTDWQPAGAVPSTDLTWELPSPYAVRFAKALRQVITLCGGKRSSF